MGPVLVIMTSAVGSFCFRKERNMRMKDGKKKHLKLWLLLALLVVGSFVMTNTKVTTVQAATSRTIRTNGRTYLEWHNQYYNTVLYQRVYGGYRQVARSSGYLQYRFSYGNKLYFSAGGEGRTCLTYTYTVGKKNFSLRSINMMLTQRYGRYAVGYITQAGDPSPSSLCCYDLARRRVTRLGRGCDIKFIGNKIYYAHVYNRNTMQVIRRNANGTGRRVVKTISAGRNYTMTYMWVDSAHKVRYYAYPNSGYGAWKMRTVRF